MGGRTDGWIGTHEELLSSNTNSVIYLASLYWGSTVMATVGYGDITGNTTGDFLFTMFMFVILLVLLAFWCLHVLVSFGQCQWVNQPS